MVQGTILLFLIQFQEKLLPFILFILKMWKVEQEHGPADYPWAIVSDDSYSGEFSWTDSPGGPYTTNLNAALTSPSISLVGSSNTILQFKHKYDIEPRGEFLNDAANLENKC